MLTIKDIKYKVLIGKKFKIINHQDLIHEDLLLFETLNTLIFTKKTILKSNIKQIFILNNNLEQEINKELLKTTLISRIKKLK